ncbi:SGNH/GDSL hydrolase family protein [Ornithinimicrobium pekingense]|uniref:Lipase 1 n=1 Tax=Ornithinimicrobium pekingense TaxID=384677 RepID=A0ABQ2F6P0_9MICO|nr:SGNH/GDSL hydrolase family protein [Ornithinimicrobium pekingense]GGK59104.1 lipase 1 [Ornithinimicrobium pekingense]
MERTPRRALPALLTTLAVAAPLALAAGPAQAAPPEYTYDALGDSYAAGFGLAPEQAHPSLLDGRMRIALDDAAAIPGATVTSLAGQLAALDDETDLVTLSVGGNNLPWTQVVLTCATQPDEVCLGATTGVSGTVATQLPAGLATAYSFVKAAAPGAHVVVTGYPRLFSPEYGDYTGSVGPLSFTISVAEQHAMNALADQLNTTIAQVAQASGVQYVDVATRFDGHGINAPDAWIGDADDPEALHPTAEGQRAYAAALTAAINPRDLRR